jgi:hypothetical protein
MAGVGSNGGNGDGNGLLVAVALLGDGHLDKGVADRVGDEFLERHVRRLACSAHVPRQSGVENWAPNCVCVRFWHAFERASIRPDEQWAERSGKTTKHISVQKLGSAERNPVGDQPAVKARTFFRGLCDELPALEAIRRASVLRLVRAPDRAKNDDDGLGSEGYVRRLSTRECSKFWRKFTYTQWMGFEICSSHWVASSAGATSLVSASWPLQTSRRARGGPAPDIDARRGGKQPQRRLSLTHRAIWCFSSLRFYARMAPQQASVLASLRGTDGSQITAPYSLETTRVRLTIGSKVDRVV